MKISKKDQLYFKRMLVTLFRPCLCDNRHTKRYHYFIIDSGAAIELWRRDERISSYCKLEQCYVTKTSPARKQGEYWKF